MQKHNGFSLLEMVLVIAVMGAATVIAALVTSNASSMWEIARIERADEDNRLRAKALLQFAQQENMSQLPAPYSGNGFTSTVANPADTTLQAYFSRVGMTPSAINTDETAADRVAVYQKITLADTVAIFGAAGEQVNINYDVGVIYQTSCSVTDTGCNPNAVSGLPGDSEAMTTTNYQTWDVQGQDVRPYIFSTYPLQVDAVHETASRLLTLKDAFRALYNAVQLASAPGDISNFYPLPNNTGAPDLSSATASADEGCENGWYQLDAANVNVLSQIGLTPTSVYGQTVFGGAIEYCQDYDPALAGAGSQPHNAALRVTRNLSTSDDPSTLGGNLILSM